MVQGYYTLQEAAKVLGMAPDELKQMAQKNQIRSFQDRGTWRFRIQDIQELARQRGGSSDPDLPLGEASPSKPSQSNPPKSKLPKSSKPRNPTKAALPEVFDFALDAGDENVGIGLEATPKKSPSRPGSKKPESKKSDSKKSPQPPPGSDSDVRLVSDGSDLEFVFDAPGGGTEDSDVKLVPADSNVKLGQPSPQPGKSPLPRKSGLAPESPLPKKSSKPGGAPVDSGSRLVPFDSDSDVKIVGAGSDEIPLGDIPARDATDSDIRLESGAFNPPRSDEGLLTEEINLDEELRKQEARSQQKPQAKVRPKSKVVPTPSPFELSESELKLPPSKPGSAPAKPDSSDFDLTPAGQKADSSDFDLTPASQKPDSSDFDLSPGKAVGEEGATSDFDLAPQSSADFSLEIPDEPSSGERELKGPSSGISLGNPADAGISLEQGGEGSDEIEFELSLDAEATPKPAQAKADQNAGESSEFELSLDVDDSQAQGEASSDSEFELTLDDSGGLAPLEEDNLQVKDVKAGEDKDIFETDFEVPALDEESGSQVAALDTDLDSSDFDLALGDSDIASDDESGSQVVALDEEEADEAAATVAAKGRPEAAALEEEVAEEEGGGFSELEGLDEEEPAAIEEAAAEAGPVREVVRERVVKTAPWGLLPVLVMLPCVVVMVLVGLLGLELVQHMTGYKPPGFLTKTISELVGQKPK